MMTRRSRFRTTGLRSNGDRQLLIEFLRSEFGLTDQEYRTVCGYLERRGEEVKAKDTFGIVYDITRYCNLECVHCCVNARLTTRPGTIPWETTTEQVKTILDKVHAYTSGEAFPNVFLIFGGGEPTMRPDFPEIVDYAAAVFGMPNVGVNSNGTYWTSDELLAVEQKLGVIEVSIDGFADYHNAWRNPHRRSVVGNPFERTVEFVRQATNVPEVRDKLEVSSVVTEDNLESIEDFIRFLEGLGVVNYSIHRAMPVGRMGMRSDKIPNCWQYIRLLLKIAELRESTAMKRLHLHHSLESIYSVLFLGFDIHRSTLLTGSKRHSIGLDPEGNVFFDPWCVVAPFKRLAAGNLLEEAVGLKDIVEGEDSLIRLANDVGKRQLRCRGCRMDCSGGMRFNAMGHYVHRLPGKPSRASESTLIAGLAEIDPACPLYEP